MVQAPNLPRLTDRDLDPESIVKRQALFDKYVMPYLNMIYKLCIKYSFSPNNVPDNYTEVLTNFYRRIETYDTSRPILTWLHIVTKRTVYSLERQRNRGDDGIHNCGLQEADKKEFSDPDFNSSNVIGVENYRNLYNDDILALLDELPASCRDALILQEAGYSLKEIVRIEYAKGALKSKNIETIKSRLRKARQHLKNNLTRDGERISHKANRKDV